VDIKRVAKDLGESFTLDEIREMIDKADRNGENSCSFFHWNL